MTDYADLNHLDNKKFKEELVRFLNILNSNNIHYWVDFATLAKITSNNVYLHYLSGFDICVFDDSYKKIISILREFNFRVWSHSEHLTGFSYSDLFLFKSIEDKLSTHEVLTHGMLKWVMIWNYKLLDNNKTSLGIEKDYIYDKNIFTDVEEVDYCDIKVKIPKNYKQIFEIRNNKSDKVIFCNSPKKRENNENSFGFSNIGNYK